MTTAAAGLRLLFRTAAGPRLGYGHLIRCRSLSRALGTAPAVSLRGTAVTQAVASRLGFTLIGDLAGALAATDRPCVLVIDDPSASHAAIWVRRARSLGVPVATVHDLGLGYVQADLGIDGSVRPHRAMVGRAGDLHGPTYAMLDPRVERWRERRGSVAEADRVLIALGGGAHVLSLAAGLADAIAAHHPAVRIRVATGFTAGRRLPPLAAGRWVAAPDGLAEELARSTVAVLAGGVSLYEACAIGVPSVAVALTPAQGLTIRGVAEGGAVIDGGDLGRSGNPATRVARHVRYLLADARARRRLAAHGRTLVDGRGIYRVADRLEQLVQAPGETRRAA